MKLLTNIKRELTLLSRGIYFYVEVAFAAVALIALLVVIPEKFDIRATEIVHVDNHHDSGGFVAQMLGYFDWEEVEIRGIAAERFTTKGKIIYTVNSEEDLIELAKATGDLGVIIRDDSMEFWLQGNETPQFRDYALLSLSSVRSDIQRAAEAQSIRQLENNPRTLNDRQNLLPLILSVNCAMMGIFVTTAFIVEDKKTKVIKALRVVPSGITNYLVSKMVAVFLMSFISCLVIAVPVMGGAANYPLLLLTVLSGAFLSVSIGALMASFYNDIGNAFGGVFTVLIVFLVPCILSIIPMVNAPWAAFIPSHYIVRSVKESLLNRDWQFVLLSSAGLAALGLAIMPFSIRRYRAAGIGLGG